VLHVVRNMEAEDVVPVHLCVQTLRLVIIA
jgi:hypothetical protein